MTDQEIVELSTQIAWKLGSAWNLSPEDLSDLSQETAVAALHALVTYDNEKGTSESFWVRTNATFAARLWLATRQHQTVGVSRWAARFQKNRALAEAHLAQEHLREPRNQEVADYMGLTLNEFEEMRALVGDVQAFDEYCTVTDTVGEEEYEPAMPGLGTVAAAMDETLAVIQRTIDNMREDEAEVLRRYFGIDCEEETQTQIAEDMGLSQTGVHRLLAMAIQNLRRRLQVAGLRVEDIPLWT